MLEVLTGPLFFVYIGVLGTRYQLKPYISYLRYVCRKPKVEGCLFESI